MKFAWRRVKYWFRYKGVGNANWYDVVAFYYWTRHGEGIRQLAEWGQTGRSNLKFFRRAKTDHENA